MPTDDPALTALLESSDDSHGTRMAYEPQSRVPWYVIAAWAVFSVAYVTYQLVYLLPDLNAWFKAAGN